MDHRMNVRPAITAEELLAEAVKRRNDALIALDLAWARRMIAPFDPNASDLTLLVAMHKARYNIPAIPEALRHESAAWLRARNLSDIHGLPLLPPGQLPA